jgi:hypothetical protein
MKLKRSFQRFALAAGVIAIGSSCGGSAKHSMAGAPMADSAGATMAKQAADDGADSASGGTWKRSTLEANTSKLMVGDSESLPIRGMQVHTKVDGFRARVLIDFYFYNTYDRQLEGTFNLRLPEGATPYFLAFGQSSFENTVATSNQAAIAYTPTDEVRERTFAPAAIVEAREQEWSQVKVARMVEREKAAIAYGETTRRQVDPALLEWAGAGVFNARIFPLAPNQLHRVVVGYDMNLTRIGEDLELQLPIPKDVPSSAVDITVAAMDGVAVSMSPTAADTTANDGFSNVRMDDVQGQVLKVRLAGAGSVAIAGDDPLTGPHFAARFTPELPADAAATGADAGVLVIDRSMSSNPDKFNVWRLLAKALLEENRGTMKRFAVAFFNIETHWWQDAFVDNTPENVDALMAFIDQLSLEGASDIGAALTEAAAPNWMASAATPFNLFLLSDGAATWGESDAYAMSRGLDGARVDGLFAYRTGMSGTDKDMLDHLARETGGAVFSVVGESEIATAAVAHTARPWLLDRVSIEGGTDILVAGRPQAVFPGQRLLIAGRGALESGAAVAVHLRRGDATHTINAALDHVIASELAPRAYGQLAVGQIEEFLGTTRPFAEAYARHYRVTGKSTSLLMLETDEDYKRFAITDEKDADVVRVTTASELTTNALAAIGELLGDPKAAFLTNDRIPKVVRALLENVASTEFGVAVPRLVADNHTRDGMPANIASDLKKRTPGYDDMTAESKRRKKKHGAADALVALSSLIEANPGDSVLARDVGFTAARWGMHAHAYHLFRRVAEARPFEPQTYRALALTLSEIDRAALALAYFEIALEGEWDARFGEFRQIVALDYLRFLRTKSGQLPKGLRDHAKTRMKQLRDQLGIDRADVLISITWNTDNTDVDLHVIEPSGEEVYYSHPNSKAGGHLTRDVTQGYGPEMYVLKKAPRGKYTVRAKYFASDASRASTRSKVYATVYRNWGTDRETVEHKVVTLALGKDMHDIAVFKVK